MSLLGTDLCSASRMLRCLPSLDTSVCSLAIVLEDCSQVYWVTKIVKIVANIKYLKIVPFQLTVLLTLFQVSLSLKTAELVNAAQTCRTAVEPSLDTQTTDN